VRVHHRHPVRRQGDNATPLLEERKTMSELQSTLATPVLVPGMWDIDPGHSSVEFVARHLFSRVRGRFTEFGGTIEVTPDLTQSSAVVTIQAESIDTNHAERDEHLRNPDFLDVERFPTLAFRSSGVGGFDGSGTMRLAGDLTIRDVTRSVSLDVEYLGWSDDPWGGKRAAFSVRTEIDRDDFGANWNVVLETGGLLVGKRVLVEIEIEALLRNEPNSGQ
jgi:polyisoprenoid-binding protein YceI